MQMGKTKIFFMNVVIVAGVLLNACGMEEQESAPPITIESLDDLPADVANAGGEKNGQTNSKDTENESGEKVLAGEDNVSALADEVSQVVEEALKVVNDLSDKGDEAEAESNAAETGTDIQNADSSQSNVAATGGDIQNTDSSQSDATVQGDILHFVDVFGESYETVIKKDVPSNTLKNSGFTRNGEKLYYEDSTRTSRLGVDVSKYQRDVNWEKVAAEGYEFAFVRIGYRGYGDAGNLKSDEKCMQNLQGAKAAGLEVGVYFFSQAINEKEAAEEAAYVVKLLDGMALDLPIVYDPESILDDVARTDDVTAEQFTANTKAFCDAVTAAGYKPMLYCNMLWEAFQLDLSQLTAYPIWYADYEAYPQTPYDFVFWQYTNKGKVPGIPGEADINIQIVAK